MKNIIYSFLLVFTLFLTGCADAGKNQTVNASDIVTLDASASTASVGGKIKKYFWKQVRGKRVVLSDKRSPQVTFTAPTVSKKITLVFKVKTIEYGGRPYKFRSRDYVRVIVMPSTGEVDTTAPVITLNGKKTITLTIGDTYKDAGAIATDNKDGNLTSSIIIDGSVDTSSEGNYTITYNVVDTSGNTATEVSRTVNVTLPADISPPIITLTGGNITLLIGETYTELGATASDDRDTVVDVNISSNVDTSTANTYTVTYTAKDHAGNEATPLTRTVTVNAPKNIAPTAVITVDKMEITVGDTVHFSAEESSDEDGQIVRYQWEDDTENIVSEDNNFTHTFTQAGNFGIKLLVIDNNNAHNTTIVHINVSENNDTNISGNITISGTIKDQNNGRILSGVSLTLLKDGIFRENNTTNLKGVFTFNALIPNSNYVLVVKKENYATQVVSIKTLEKSTGLTSDIILIQSTPAQTFSATNTSTIASEYGVLANLTENSFVNTSNKLVDNDINLSITTLNTATQEGRDSLPGDLSNIAALSAAEFIFVDAITGEKVDLANGATADIILPLFNLTTSEGITLTEGDSVGLWSLNEETGIWKDEGNATIVLLASSPTGLGAKATVSHFSWWAISARTIVKAFVHIKAVGSSDSGYIEIKARTDANVAIIAGGKFVVALNDTIATTTTIPGWSSSKTCFWGESTINSSLVVTPEQCINAKPNQHYNLDFDLGNTPPVTGNSDRFYLAVRTLLNTTFTKDLQYLTANGTHATSPDMNSFQITSGSLPPGISLNDSTISGVATKEGSYRTTGTAFTSDNRGIPFSITYAVKDTSNSPAFLIGANDYPTQAELGTISLPQKGSRYIGTPNIWFKITEDNGNMNLDIAQFNVGKTATQWEISSYYYIAANNPNTRNPGDTKARTFLNQNGLLTINMPLPSVDSENASTGVSEESYIIKEEFILKASNGSQSDIIHIVFEYAELVGGGSGGDATWQDNLEVSSNTLNWNDAITYCNNLSLNGFMDWKLPTIAYFDAMSKASSSWVNNYIIPGRNYGDYWLGTSSTDEYAYAYILGDYGSSLKSGLKGVRCVRGEP